MTQIATTQRTRLHRFKRAWVRCAGPVAMTTALALAAALGGPVAATSSSSRSYMVASGDTLSAISARFGVGVSALAAANDISDPNFIEAGTTLAIPDSAGGAGAAQSSSQSASYPVGLSYYPDRLALLPDFDRAAATTGIPASLLEAIAWQESGWQSDVVSPAGAIGIGQLTPDTVAFVRAVLDPAQLDPWVAVDNIVISARFLRYLLDQTGWNEPLAIAAYYQGLAATQAYGVLPVSRQYVADVMALQQQF
ncbi:MAG: lytic transglycosylase domain-containing protein [Acidimicrobiales bacterium]